MRTIETTQTNNTSRIGYVAPWRVSSVKPLTEFQLEVQFIDGARGIVDMKNFLQRECGVFKPLREAALFNQVKVDHGAVSWPGDLDLAPDTMHDELSKSDVYVML